jgi:hypothetical protein
VSQRVAKKLRKSRGNELEDTKREHLALLVRSGWHTSARFRPNMRHSPVRRRLQVARSSDRHYAVLQQGPSPCGS